MINWGEGDWVVRREVFTNRPWEGLMLQIIEDSSEQLISYIPEGSPSEFPDRDWPTRTWIPAFAGSSVIAVVTISDSIT